MQVKHNITEANRATLSDEELIQMTGHIEKNDISKFGIVKLSQLDLHTIFQLPCGKRTTLLHYAYIFGRDRIISALIRAGCDPSLYPGVKEERTVDVIGSLLDFSMAYRAWLVRFVYDMIGQSLIESARREDTLDVTDQSDILCTCCGARNVYYNLVLLRWVPCGHRICIDCTWRGATRKLHSTQYALRCPMCNSRCDGSEEEFYNMPSCAEYMDGIYYAAGAGASHADLAHSSASERKVLSRDLWQTLPVEIDENSKAAKQSTTAIAPCPMHILSQYFIGSTQSQRSAEFHKAAIMGNVYRLYWIFRCGVDIDACDEYGQTALLAACANSQIDSVKFLLWAGADWRVEDNCHVNGLDVARAIRCEEIIRLLTEDASIRQDDIYPSVVGTEYSAIAIAAASGGDCSIRDVVVTALIPTDADHLGAGSCYIDNCFSEAFLQRLEHTWRNCPETPPTKQSCSSRYYISDSMGWIRAGIATALETARKMYSEETVSSDMRSHAINCSGVFANMRFLQYSSRGGHLPPHEDLSRTDVILDRTSTHTFILYLSTCTEGGETALLRSVVRSDENDDNVIVAPVRGRLLLFPHKCPHEGAPLIDVPKLLLRGEAF